MKAKALLGQSLVCLPSEMFLVLLLLCFVLQGAEPSRLWLIS